MSDIVDSDDIADVASDGPLKKKKKNTIHSFTIFFARRELLMTGMILLEGFCI